MPQPAASAEASFDWWICESLYSMDGDGPRVEDLRAHQSAGGLLYVDEAHAFGLFKGGRSRLAHANIQPDGQVFTFGKALGTAGAVFLGSPNTCQWIRTRARSFVFSTGPSPAQVELIDQAIDLLVSDRGEAAREQLWSNHHLFADALGVVAPQAPIFPILVGDPRLAQDVSAKLLTQGFHVQAIRPPTVPEGGSRLRLTVSATHQREDLLSLAEALHEQLPTLTLAPSPARTSPG
jgi:7-keto-8-aminopelargonate synthetase-like enzyme